MMQHGAGRVIATSIMTPLPFSWTDRRPTSSAFRSPSCETTIAANADWTRTTAGPDPLFKHHVALTVTVNPLPDFVDDAQRHIEGWLSSAHRAMPIIPITHAEDCTECGAEIPEARRKTVGNGLCIDCATVMEALYVARRRTRDRR